MDILPSVSEVFLFDCDLNLISEGWDWEVGGLFVLMFCEGSGIFIFEDLKDRRVG